MKKTRYPALTRFLADKRGVACLIFLCLEVLLLLLLPLLLNQDPNLTDKAAGFWSAPGPGHLLGTDDVGRDIFARLLYGGRVSLLVGYSTALLSALLGVPLGLLAGYKGGKWEYWIMRACDTFQAFPSIILVLCLVSLLGPSVWNIILVMGVLPQLLVLGDIPICNWFLLAWPPA